MFRVIAYRILFSILTFGFLSSQAQIDPELIDAKASYLKKAGKRSLKNGDYYSAISYFEKYREKKPENYEILMPLGDSYRFARDYDSAASKYMQLIGIDAETFPLAYYHLAEMQIRQMLYKEAKSNLETFIKNYRGASDASTYKKMSNALIQTCDSAESLLSRKQNLRIVHLDTSVNKAHIELSPYYLEDSVIVFSSLRSDTIVWYNQNDSSNKVYPTRKFYTAEKRNGEWQFRSEFEGPWNDQASHNGNGSYNLDSTLFFFTRCAVNSKGKMLCQIYQSELKEGEWTEAVPLPESVNQPGYNSSQPTVGYSMKYEAEVLYFVSDRPRGRGGLDIWYSEYRPRRSEWKKAKNLGKGINTILDEMTPHYDNESKMLFFSSEGWPGIGGLDVFRSIGELKSWNTPENLGPPVNSSMDELYYVESSSGSEGLFVSNRKGGINLKNETCCDDLYEFREIKVIQLAIQGTANKVLRNSLGQDSLVPFPHAKLAVYALQDSTNETILIKEIETGADGTYFLKLKKGVEYAIEAKSDSTLSDNFAFSTKKAEKSDTLVRDFSLYEISEEPIVVKNIYYEFDKADLTASSTTTIDTTLLLILEKNPSIIIEIGSHTDSKGTDSYNETLSQKRAESVVTYLIKKGISANRLKAKGYGEKVPIAPNENEDGTDNPEGRAMNRRTEFKIVGKIPGVSEIIYRK